MMISTTVQDGVTRTRFALPHETTKNNNKTNQGNNNSQDFGHLGNEGQ